MLRKIVILLCAICILLPAVSAQADAVFFLDRTVKVSWLRFAKSADLFTADAEAQGVLRITNTTPDKSYWGYVVLNGRTYWLNNNDTFVQPVSLKPFNAFFVSLLGAPGTTLHIEILPPKPAITAFTITPASVAQGSTATLAWATENADTVAIEPGIGPVNPDGSITVTPDATTTYTLTAANDYGSVSATATVTVLYPPALTILEPDGFNDIADEFFTIQWEDEDPDSDATISLYYDTDNTGADGILIALGLSEDPDGMDDRFTWDTSAVPQGDYYIYAIIDDGETPAVTAYSSGPVTVVTPPTVTILAEPSSINIGQSATLTWNAINADTIFIDQGIGSVASSGSITVTPQTTTTYTITASSPVGTVSSNATVTVANPFTITIISPLENEVVPLSDDGMADIVVRGRVENTTGWETGVNVNGIIASLSGNEFAVNLSLTEEGDNTITVTAVDLTGGTDTRSITVHAVFPAHYICLSANPESAAAPMNVYLRLGGSFSTANPVITVFGPGTVDQLTSDDPEEYGYKINTAGIYFFTTEAIGPDGNTYQDTIAVTALDLVEMDTMLRAKWSAFTNAMQQKDIPAMLGMMMPHSREKYQVMFDLLKDQLQEIVATYTGLELGKIAENAASYELKAVEDGVRRASRVGFMQDTNGLWYIEEF